MPQNSVRVVNARRTALMAGNLGPRKLRRPTHTFNLRAKPFQIVPFMIAPVMPGETMKNLRMQSRVVSDPINNPLIGWWKEYYFFYVKLSDLADRDNIIAAMLDPTDTTIRANDAAAVEDYHYTGGINWTQLCIDEIVRHYFRDGDESLTGGQGFAGWGSYYVAKVSQDNWLDSFIEDDDFEDPAVGDDDLASGTAGQGDATTAVRVSEIEKALREYKLLREANLTVQTWDDFLATYGVDVPPETVHRPELVRYLREWTYPTNTINPSGGAASSACSWSIAERADKDRFFKEPGFLVGLTVTRPKVYFGNMRGSLAGYMTDMTRWLPAGWKDDPYASFVKFTAGGGPLPIITDDYWVDIKDLFIHGDQFANYDHNGASSLHYPNTVALPVAGGNKKYPVEADANGLFVGTSDVAPGTRYVREDGVVELSIASAIAGEDTSA